MEWGWSQESREGVKSPGTGQVSRSQRHQKQSRLFPKGGLQARDQICNLHIYILLRSFRLQPEEWMGGWETREEAVTVT